MLKGLEEVENNLSRKNIPFYLLIGSPESIISEWLRIHDIKVIVTDFDPLHMKRSWKKSISERINIPFYEIDAHNDVLGKENP